MKPVIFGEVLFDCFEDGQRVLGGAPFNVAWHLAALGQQPEMISCIGEDVDGETLLQKMRDVHMSTTGIQTSGQYPTGQVKVSLVDGQPHYDIVKPAAWDFIQAERLPALDDVAFLYHGSLALRHAVSEQAFLALQKRTAAPVFVDVNLREPWWQRDRVVQLLQHADWIKLNEDELARLYPEEQSTQHRVRILLALPKLKYLLLTRGEAGAELYNKQAQVWRVAPDLKAIHFVDAVGAGDAFSSVFLLGLMLRWPEQTLLDRAQAFASAIVGIRGAIPDHRGFYKKFLDAWGI